jgi:hypothetical protein
MVVKTITSVIGYATTVEGTPTSLEREGDEWGFWYLIAQKEEYPANKAI